MWEDITYNMFLLVVAASPSKPLHLQPWERSPCFS